VYGWTPDTVYTIADVQSLTDELAEVLGAEEWRARRRAVRRALFSVLVGTFVRVTWVMQIIYDRLDVMDAQSATGALSTQETFALCPVCRASRQTVDEMRLPVAVFFFPKLDHITAGDGEARQMVRTHKDLPGNFRESGSLQNVLRCWTELSRR
jgi:hypothetical protein